jgi:DNA repair protein RecN (Recombination protein N)
MLSELRVGNLALVDDLVLPLQPGLTMLTGETGAGKSLIAGALSLLAGGKADRGLIREGEELAFVEGVFDLEREAALAELAGSLGIRLGADGLLVLRREIRREGRGRVLINGLVSSLPLLEQIGSALLSIQSQDQQRVLSRSSFPRNFLDRMLENEPLREEMAATLDQFHTLQAQYEARLQEERFAREQLDMWRYQMEELAAADLVPGEEEELGEKLALGRNSRALLEAAGAAREGLTEGQTNARELLGAAEGILAPLSDDSPRLRSILEMIRDAQSAVSEAAVDLERFLDGVDVDPSQLDDMEARKSLYEDLRRKYDRTVEGLIELRDSLAQRIDRQQGAASDLEKLATELDTARQEVETAAMALRRGRREGAGRIAARAVETIRPLALPDLETEFTVEPDLAEDGEVAVEGKTCRVTREGADRVRLLVRTNRGESMGEVGRVASGGERSRIYLGLSVLGGAGTEPALQLFDEIDAGLGMDNAVPVAELLAHLAVGKQVICITHLATVAARGEHHLKVEKISTGGRTVLKVAAVPGEDRVQEIARLLGGKKSGAARDTKAQVAYARQLLDNTLSERRGTA